MAADDTKTRAVNLVKQIVADQLDKSDAMLASPADVAAIAEAIEVDLVAANLLKADAKDTEERLLKVEVQTRLLSNAVVAIAAPADDVAPAIKAVKAEM